MVCIAFPAVSSRRMGPIRLDSPLSGPAAYLPQLLLQVLGLAPLLYHLRSSRELQARFYSSRASVIGGACGTRSWPGALVNPAPTKQHHLPHAPFSSRSSVTKSFDIAQAMIDSKSGPTWDHYIGVIRPWFGHLLHPATDQPVTKLKTTPTMGAGPHAASL